MASGNRGKKSASSQKYREILEQSGNLVASQTYNELYAKLLEDGRISRFLAAVQYCSTLGLKKKDTVKKLCECFPGYISESELTVECFDDMLKEFSDVAVAWGYGPQGDVITDIVIKNKALSLIEKTESMQDIQIYKTIYEQAKKDEIEHNENGTTITFNLTKQPKG